MLYHLAIASSTFGHLTESSRSTQHEEDSPPDPRSASPPTPSPQSGEGGARGYDPALIPPSLPVAQAQWKLYPPIGPNASSASPMM